MCLSLSIAYPGCIIERVDMVKVVVVGKEWGMDLESLLSRWAGDLKISIFLNPLPYGAINLRPFLTYGAQPTP